MTPSSVPASPSDAWTASPTPASGETPRAARSASIASGVPAASGPSMPDDGWPT